MLLPRLSPTPFPWRWGPVAGNIVALCAAVGCLGSLGGWTLLVGQTAKAAADDGLFGNVFARVNCRGVPSAGLAIVAGIMTLQVLATMVADRFRAVRQNRLDCRHHDVAAVYLLFGGD